MQEGIQTLSLFPIACKTFYHLTCKKLLQSCSFGYAGLPQSMTKHALRIKLMSESVSWCAHHLQNGDGRVQMGSGLLKVVGSSAHVGGQVLKWKGQPCSLGMAFTIAR